MVKELVNRWSACQIVHGRPRHSQSQGSVERANQDLERILCTQLREEKSTRIGDFIEGSDVCHLKQCLVGR
ncbi:unnamed protein product, partial [Mesorhabditis belari]|uniref:Integrase catalytic domain-containing protein n=1 Tax=Mesorhabditis belari TaxID=2138241 RepID=A0AAF3J675_9BILA